MCLKNKASSWSTWQHRATGSFNHWSGANFETALDWLENNFET